MSRIENTVDRITRYLKGLLSNRERHDLERDMMQDVFDEEAFEGLNRLSGEELEADMEKLMTRLDNRVDKKKTRNLTWFYRVAAAMVLLIGIGSILLLVVKKPADDLITQKTEQTAKPKEKATLPDEAPQTEASTTKEQAKTYPAKKSIHPEKITSEEFTIEEISVQENAVIAEEQEAIILNDEAEVTREESVKFAPVAESVEAATPVPATAKSKKDGTVRIRGVSSIETPLAISGKVMDSEGQPIPGVNVQVKGSNTGTVTDINGSFALQSPDPDPVIAFSFIGYVPVEMKGSDLHGREITMTEDMVALNEVVVVGYGTQNRMDADDAQEKSAYSYTRPIPPNQSYKEFKEWVENRVDKSLFISFSGKHRILIHLTVALDGSLRSIRAEDKVPSVITDEYIRVIAASETWQPAKENGTPVEAEIALRFVLEVE